MKEFIEKLISRLEDTRWTTIFDTQCIFENDKLDKCIEIVNELAEEYINTSTDTSSERNKALDSLHKKILSNPKMCEIVTEEEIMALVEAKNNGWIPCSERLPDKRDWYLAVFQEYDSDFVLLPRVADYVGKKTNFTTNEGWLIIDLEGSMCDYFKKLKCIAWQPLPAPYKEGE